jgi:hypothetical protein
MVVVDHPISQPSLDISSIWTDIIAAEVSKLRIRQVCEQATVTIVFQCS